MNDNMKKQIEEDINSIIKPKLTQSQIDKGKLNHARKFNKLEQDLIKQFNQANKPSTKFKDESSDWKNYTPKSKYGSMESVVASVALILSTSTILQPI